MVTGLSGVQFGLKWYNVHVTEQNRRSLTCLMTSMIATTRSSDCYQLIDSRIDSRAARE